MKKDIEWLKAEVEKQDIVMGKGHIYTSDLIYLIDQLDEPEVLSWEWIGRNKFEVNGWNEAVHVEDLQNLLVPKQELPVIPQFVADYLEKAKKEIDLLRVFEIANGLNELDMWRKEYNWIRLYHLDFARAWLDGYEVEEEQKYYVINNKNYFLLAKDKAHGFVFSTGGNSKLGNTDISSAKFELTEQEIKNYDERYWAFAKPVEEMEE